MERVRLFAIRDAETSTNQMRKSFTEGGYRDRHEACAAGAEREWMKVSKELAKILKQIEKEVSKWKPWQRTANDPCGRQKGTTP